MPKKILLIEESDTIRNIAESLLRQNGYEVLSISSGEKALEVLGFTRPDLIIAASDAKYKNHAPMYEKLTEDPKSQGIPILVMHTESETGISFPPELLIVKPFSPKEFIQKVSLLADSQIQARDSHRTSGGSLEIEDAALDSALGLDQLEVTESEEMDKTVQKRRSANSEDISDMDMTGKVVSLSIKEDKEISHDNMEKPVTKPLNETNKLDILEDQFGMLETSKAAAPQPNKDHDYNWFLNELQTDGSKKTHQQNPPKPQQTAKSYESDSQKLTFEDVASKIDPITPAKLSDDPSTKGVDKFIDEFKKEVEKISSHETESITLKDSEYKKTTSANWHDSVGSVSKEQIEIFKKQFVAELAEKIAVKLADKIDADKLLLLIKQEIVNQSKK